MALPEPLNDGTIINMSIIGHATSEDGLHFDNRTAFIRPEEDWEKYGCEDPRVTKLDGKYYIFYTALSRFPFSADGIKVALGITKDLNTLEERRLITPFNAKAMALFPEKINGKFVVITSVDTDRPPSTLAIREFEKEEDLWDHDGWEKWYQDLDLHSIDPRRADTDHVEVGAPPIKTAHGWLLVYSHINHYFDKNPVFGIEALLLDLNDPRKIIGRTSGPIMVPERSYEKFGHVPNVIFPSGALVRNGNIEIYYGGTDTVGCRAKINLNNFVNALLPQKVTERVKRFESNPLLTAKKENLWESKYVFNPGAIDIDGEVQILYRAIGEDGVSTIGLARSKDGMHIDTRLENPIYIPREAFESRGCEDPRIVNIDGTLYMNYTAWDGVNAPQIAITSIKESDFLSHKWDTWSSPALISPAGIMDKDACVLPEKTSRGYMIFHRIGENICVDFVDTLDFKKESLKKCIQLLQPRKGMWDSDKVGIAAPPIKSEAGWILFYHGVAEDRVYRVGVALLERDNPSNLLATTSAPLLEPLFEYEKRGQTPNVVFPCGAILRRDTIYLYYGGADSVVAGASIKLQDILKMFK